MKNYLECSHHNAELRDGRYYCTDCGIEMFVPDSLCHCHVVQDEDGIHRCTYCGAVYDDDYLRNAVSQ